MSGLREVIVYSMPESVIVYSTPLCAPCEALKRILNSEGIPFAVKDLMTDEEAATLMDEHDVRSAPALGIDGAIYSGEELRPDRLVELLYL